jgi:hypothetical protein
VGSQALRRQNWSVTKHLVILSKLLLRSEGSGRAARTVAIFATEQSRVWLASVLNCNLPPLFGQRRAFCT